MASLPEAPTPALVWGAARIDKRLKNYYSDFPVCIGGDVSEWSKEAVLKTVEPQGSVGSNPTISGQSDGEVREWSNRAPC